MRALTIRAARTLALRRRKPIPLTGKDFDPERAARLDAITAELVGA